MDRTLVYEVWRWGSYLKGVRTTTGLGSLECSLTQVRQGRRERGNPQSRLTRRRRASASCLIRARGRKSSRQLIWRPTAFASDICGGLGEAAFGEMAERDSTGLGDRCPMGRLAVVATVGGVSPLSRMVLAAKK
jgi:hypothetical protein